MIEVNSLIEKPRQMFSLFLCLAFGVSMGNLLLLSAQALIGHQVGWRLVRAFFHPPLTVLFIWWVKRTTHNNSNEKMESQMPERRSREGSK